MKNLIKTLKTPIIIGVLLTMLVTCDLFTGIKREDLIDQIDRDLAWAAAERVTVTVIVEPISAACIT